MKILLIEDEAPKRKHIEELLKKIAPRYEILVATSINAALSILDTGAPTAILLDMSLPTFDMSDRDPGGRAQGFGGVEVLRHMQMSEIHCPVIVITGLDAFSKAAGEQLNQDQLRELLEKDFPELYRGLLHFNSTLDEWRASLTNALLDLHIPDIEP